VHQRLLKSLLVLGVFLLPGQSEGQVIFDWPLRAAVQPEGVLTGAGAVFWNPGGLAPRADAPQEIWVIHVDGPDATGVRGVGAAGVANLPAGMRIGVGYWHLGIENIPRTTSSPSPEPGGITVSEDVALLSLARVLGASTGVGAGIRFQRGAVGKEARSRMVGDVGVHHGFRLPLSPRFGLSLQGLGGDLVTVLGAEATLASLAGSRIPIRGGLGLQAREGLDLVDKRLSLRGSWMDQLHLGLGLSHLADGGGWTSIWALGADLGRYSLSVLREGLANDFGPVHYFQASVRLPS